MGLMGISSLSFASPPVVLVFLIDGLQGDAAKVAIENGAENLKYLVDNGVWVEEAYCTSPAPRLELPDGTMPWSTTSSPNVSIHTGTHVFASRAMDDIFLSAGKAGITSVFAGGAGNYKVFNTPDFSYAGSMTDEEVVAHGIRHFREDGARLIRLHLQRIRSKWEGAGEKLIPGSAYQQHILKADSLLGKLIRLFREEGVWDHTYVITAADHGMGKTEESVHPPSVASSWSVYMNFYGPDIKKGVSIPYAETPDLGIMINHFLNLSPLRGHLDPDVTVKPAGTTGSFLSHIFEGNAGDFEHPAYIKRYLESHSGSPPGDFQDYHKAMVSYLKEGNK